MSLVGSRLEVTKFGRSLPAAWTVAVHLVTQVRRLRACRHRVGGWGGGPAHGALLHHERVAET